MASRVLTTLKTDLERAKDGANTAWERFAVFLHAHPKSACVIVLIFGVVVGAIFF